MRGPRPPTPFGALPRTPEYAQQTKAMKNALVDFAREAGFAKVRICRPDAVDFTAQLDAFVDAGFHGQMSWMAERMDWRSNPSVLWPDAKSVVMLAEPYTQIRTRLRRFSTTIGRRFLFMRRGEIIMMSSKSV